MKEYQEFSQDTQGKWLRYKAKELSSSNGK